MHRLRLLPLVALLGACSDGSDDDFPDIVTCGDTPPTLGDVTVTDLGDREIGGQTRRVLQVSAPADDVDGDLFTYRALVWYDTRTDATDWAERPNVQVTVEIVDDPTIGGDTDPDGACRFHEVSAAGALVAVGGTDVPAGEPVRFGLVIEDAAGHASNGGVPVGVVFTTPAVD